MASQDKTPLTVVITPRYNGRYSVAVGDAPPIEVIRWYRLESDYYVHGVGLTTLYFMSKGDAEAYVAAGNPGTVCQVYDDRFVTVEWELPNGGCVVDLSDVIDYLHTTTQHPEFFTYHQP